MITKIKINKKQNYVEYYDDDKRHRKFFTRTKPAEREREMNQFISSLKYGNEDKKGNSENDSYLPYFERYIEINRNQWRLKTFQTYQSKVKIYSDYLKEHKLMSSPVTSKLFLEYLLKLGRTNAYINGFFELFRQICKYEKIEDIFDVKKLREKKLPYTPFPEKVKEYLIGYLRENDFQLYVSALMMYYCYIRPEEFRNLKAKNVDLAAKTITIPGNVSKNDKTQIVTIPQTYLEILNQYLKNANPDDYIFCSKGGSTGPYPYKKDGMNVRHNKILRAKEIDGTYYNWKPTGMIDALKSGVPIQDIQLQARHHSLDQLKSYLSAYTLIQNTSFDSLTLK